MKRFILLIFLFPIHVISQNLPLGFANFLSHAIDKKNNQQDFQYNLYTDSTCSNQSYYGYMTYELYNDRIYIYNRLVLHPKDSSLKSDKIIPSIGYMETFNNTPRPGITDTIYKADEESFFTVLKLENDRLYFSVNSKLNLWIKKNETIKFYPPITFLKNEYPFEVEQFGKIILPETTKSEKISLQDSITLCIITKDLIEAFKNKETEKIKNNSLDLIHNQFCNGLICPIDSFIKLEYKYNDHFLFDSYKKRGAKISKMVMPNFHPKYLPNNYEKDLIVFEAQVSTYDHEDLNFRGDGLNYCFYFIKINNEFKFFLFNCIPK